MSLNIFDSMNATGNLFGLWISLLQKMRLESDLKKTMMAFISILSVVTENTNTILKMNVGNIMKEIVLLSKKLTEIKEKKNYNQKRKPSDESYDSDDYDDLSSKKNNYLDLNEEDDDDDEDYEDNDTDLLSTQQDDIFEFLYLRDFLSYLYQNNITFYNQLFSCLDDVENNTIQICVSKAENRNSNKQII